MEIVKLRRNSFTIYYIGTANSEWWYFYPCSNEKCDSNCFKISNIL